MSRKSSRRRAHLPAARIGSSPAARRLDNHEEHPAAPHVRGRSVLAKRSPSDDQGLMKIGDVARRSGLSRQMISSYCMYGLIREAARTPKGHRLFDEKVLRRLRLIRGLVEHGYTLRDIREIFIRDRL